MNEKIKKLAKEAGLDYDRFSVYQLENFDEERFAELIIKECIDIAETYDKGLENSDKECVTCRKVAYTIADRIKQTFGNKQC